MLSHLMKHHVLEVRPPPPQCPACTGLLAFLPFSPSTSLQLTWSHCMPGTLLGGEGTKINDTRSLGSNALGLRGQR